MLLFHFKQLQYYLRMKYLPVNESISQQQEFLDIWHTKWNYLSKLGEHWRRNICFSLFQHLTMRGWDILSLTPTAESVWYNVDVAFIAYTSHIRRLAVYSTPAFALLGYICYYHV